MSNYSYDPRAYVPEYNVNGDSANGRAGSQTPGAVTAQNSQPQAPGTNKNPYGDILNYLQPMVNGGGPASPQRGYGGAPTRIGNPNGGIPGPGPNVPDVSPQRGNNNPYLPPADPVYSPDGSLRGSLVGDVSPQRGYNGPPQRIQNPNDAMNTNEVNHGGLTDAMSQALAAYKSGSLFKTNSNVLNQDSGAGGGDGGTTNPGNQTGPGSGGTGSGGSGGTGPVTPPVTPPATGSRDDRPGGKTTVAGPPLATPVTPPPIATTPTDGKGGIWHPSTAAPAFVDASGKNWGGGWFDPATPFDFSYLGGGKATTTPVTPPVTNTGGGGGADPTTGNPDDLNTPPGGWKTPPVTPPVTPPPVTPPTVTPPPAGVTPPVTPPTALQPNWADAGKGGPFGDDPGKWPDWYSQMIQQKGAGGVTTPTVTPPFKPPPDPVVPPPAPGSGVLPGDGTGVGDVNPGGGPQANFPANPGPLTTGQVAPSGQDLASQLRSLLQPGFQNEQTQLQRILTANAGHTGDINSGGFGETLGRQEGNLIGQQSGKVADLLNTNSENALNRAMDYYKTNQATSLGNRQIDSGQAIAAMQNDTVRLGIHTNDDLQRYLNSQDNVLKKYGIDAQSVLGRYQAELGLQGTQISAGAQVNAAALNAATGQAIAAANRDAAIHASDNNYNLGLGQLAQNQYQFNNISPSEILKYYLSLSPEQQAAVAGQMGGTGGLFSPTYTPKP